MGDHAPSRDVCKPSLDFGHHALAFRVLGRGTGLLSYAGLGHVRIVTSEVFTVQRSNGGCFASPNRAPPYASSATGSPNRRSSAKNSPSSATTLNSSPNTSLVA